MSFVSNEKYLVVKLLLHPGSVQWYRRRPAAAVVVALELEVVGTVSQSRLICRPRASLTERAESDRIIVAISWKSTVEKIARERNI